MTLTQELLDVLCCPAERHPLRPVDGDDLLTLNDAIARGRARYAGGRRVTDTVESALATPQGNSFYPIQHGVPVLLPTSRITIGDGGPDEERLDEAPPPPDPSERAWETLASQWHARQPPTRPAPEDTALLQSLVGEALAGCEAPRALLLGVTPEIATMSWPAGTRLVAIDGSAAMIREVWPARAVAGAAVIRGEWGAMPLRDGAFDIVVGDASLGFQLYPGKFFEVVGEVRRVLRGGGAVATRVYTRPEERESLDAIFADLLAGRIGTIDYFRWRVLAALHGDRSHGALFGDLWDAWAARVPDPSALVEALGWPPDAVEIMEALRHSRFPMIFPTLREFRQDLSGAFVEVACESPACEDGDRNPTVVLRARPR